MTRPGLRRPALSLAALVVTVGGLSGCGGEEPGPTAAPDDTGSGDFCAAYAELLQETVGRFSDVPESDPEATDLVPTLKEYAARLGEVGPPADIPEDARRGFELSVQAIDDLPDEATEEELLSQGDDASEAEQADTAAFATYIQAECPDALDGLAPSGPPSDPPS